MKVYDTLIIGSGYASVGYAAACPNTVICEEHQICDTGFYLPQRSFRYKHYVPKTEEGKELLEAFCSLSLFREHEQNTSGFEFAFCKYLAKRDWNLFLKCRVIGMEERADRVFDVTVQTNEGLSHLYAKKILDTTNESGEQYFSVLFVCNDLEMVRAKLLDAYREAEIEPAFYPNRFALHIKACNRDENRIKLDVYEIWKSLDIDAKILYMAPVFYGQENSNPMCDRNYDNPIKAFEAGYFYAKETNR